MMNASGSAKARLSLGAAKLRAGEGTGSHSWHFTKALSSIRARQRPGSISAKRLLDVAASG